MENISIPNIDLIDDFLNIFSDFTVVIYGILSLIILAVLLFLLLVVYQKIRRRFPLKVNCWFCNNNTTVPYVLSNSWDCPHCHQYNGFSKDGDYNKHIPQQFNFKLNESNFNVLRTSPGGSKESTLQSNGFCKLCNINQQLKIQQLASFVPINEDNYYKEIEQYREKLEKAYKLCSKCERTLEETLEKQKYNLLQNRLNSHKQNISVPQKLEKLTKFSGDNFLFLFKRYGAIVLKIVDIICALLLFLALLIHFETEYQFMNLTLTPVFEPLLPSLKVLLNWKNTIYYFKRELSFCGLVCCFLTQSENYLRRNHNLVVWGLLHIFLWSSFTGLQVLLSGICLLLNIQTSQTKFIKLNKKLLPKKFGFQPVKKVFPEFSDSLKEESKPMNVLSAPLTRTDSFTSLNEDMDLMEDLSMKKVKHPRHKLRNSSDGKEKVKLRHREDEIESFPSEEKEKPEAVVLNSSPNTSSINKPLGASLETEKNERESNGAFSEVFNTLNSLQLGGTQKKTNKPPNFLFANHNFSEVKNQSSIIKPAKFIKNLNSSSWTESNECNSRSSTPSSGYSSQKPEKQDQNRYDFLKTMTPISVNSFNRHSPTNCFDYYDGNHGFYNTVNCFPPGCMPFQQFPGSMGHTTIYTCTRPTNFPFPFSPWQGFLAQKFSPTSPRFSDASDCDNLFQESSKKFEQSKKLSNLKTIFYYFSIFFNFISIMGLVYFISNGNISVDWILPKFNFFV